MNNNTKIKLRLSKQLFESLAKQVLREGKNSNMSGGAYTEAVKQPKGEKKSEKSEKNEDLNLSKNDVPQVKMTGASKQQVGQKLKKVGTDLMSRVDAKIQSGEGAVFLELLTDLLDIADDEDNASTSLKRVKQIVDVVMKSKNKEGEVNLSKNDVPQIRKTGQSMSEMSSKEKMAKGLYKEDDTMDFQSGAFDVSEMGKKKSMKEDLGRKMAAEDLMGAISSGDPVLTGAILVGLVAAGILSADKVANTVKGYYKALTQKDPAAADKLAQDASDADIDVKQ